MKRTGTILLGLLFAFLAVNVAYSASALHITADSPEASGGTIAGGAGNGFQVDFYFDYTNDADIDHLCGTVGFYFFSNDGSLVNVTHTDQSGDDPFGSLVFANDWTSTWSIGFQFINQGGLNVGYNGELPDSIYITGITTNGLAPNLGNLLMYSFHFEVLQSTTGSEGTLCVDSAGPNPVAPGDLDWLLDDAAEVVDFNGPYCWTITGLAQTDVSALDSGDLLPTEFGLSQNYPNPFNPSTTFDFALPTKADVQINVFNVLGQKVATLADKEYAAGTYQVTWDGTNDRGEHIASGVYFYTMKAGDYTQTRKLMMVK